MKVFLFNYPSKPDKCMKYPKNLLKNKLIEVQ